MFSGGFFKVVLEMKADFPKYDDTFLLMHLSEDIGHRIRGLEGILWGTAHSGVISGGYLYMAHQSSISILSYTAMCYVATLL